MKARIVLMVIGVFCPFSAEALADRTLEKSEVLRIFEQLTSQPRKTWISTGTIQASHEEYKAPKTTDPNAIETTIRAKTQEHQSNLNKTKLDESLRKMDLDAIPFNVRYELANEYTMKSSVVVKFDGERFYWEINVDSRTDSVTPDKDIAENFMVCRFDRDWNQKRIFAWDGEKYTTYFLPGNHAIVDSKGTAPHVVNGPLTAGIVPWGYGYYTYENLVSASSSAVEKDTEGETQVHLTLNMPGGIVTTFVLAPSKNYALVSYLVTGRGKSVTFRRYSDYRLVAGKWVPMAIVQEKYDSQTNRLLGRDLWTINSIDVNLPGVDSFEVNYKPDALIEFFSPVTKKAAMYRYSDTIDTDALLSDRLVYASLQSTHTQNCATVTLKYTLSKLGKDVSQAELAQLVSGATGSTSLAAMKQFVQGLGLYCRAVKTDIQTMQNLKDCQVILHIPGKSHFVVLEAIDDKYVWTIDLTSDKFYYRTDKSFFGMDWTEGVALLVSNKPINQDSNLIELPADELATIVGGAGYSCTNLLQDYDVIFCSEPIEGDCEGTYREYYERWGCKSDTSGSCNSSYLIRYTESPCIEDMYIPGACTVTAEETCYYMRACL
ncbi:MAG: cysteine peptidase family C39 domain-containing protein [Sedimentisphaerales bacterium]|jgi:hypothetical protein